MGGNAVAAEPTITYQHSSGEVFTANNLEAARGVCPVLGNMSLVEAGLLLELESIGKDKLLNTPEDRVTEKSMVDRQLAVENTRETKKTVTENPKKLADVKAEMQAYNLPPTYYPSAETVKPDKLSATVTIKQVAADENEISLTINLKDNPRSTAPDVKQDIVPEAVLVHEQERVLLQETGNNSPVANATFSPVEIVQRPDNPLTSNRKELLLEADTPEETVEIDTKETLLYDLREVGLPEPVYLTKDESIRPGLYAADRFDSETLGGKVEPPYSNYAGLIAIDTEFSETLPTDQAIEPPLAVIEFPATISELPSEDIDTLPAKNKMFHKVVIDRLVHNLAELEPDAAGIVHELLDDTVDQLRQIGQPYDEYAAPTANEAKVVENFAKIFASTNLVFDQDEIAKFVHQLVISMPVQAETKAIDDELINYALTDYGTHEGLIYLIATSKPLMKLKNTVQAALGRVVLLYPQIHGPEGAQS